MRTWAAIAVKEVIWSSVRAGRLPGSRPGSVNRVATGALLSGASVLLVTTPRHRPRRARRRVGMFADPGRAPAGRSGAQVMGSGLSDPLGDETTEVILPRGVRPPAGSAYQAPAWPAASGGPAVSDEVARDAALRDGRRPGYRSKHRRDEPEAGQWRPDAGKSRQRGPRHAAPPASFSRMAGRLAVRALAGAARD